MFFGVFVVRFIFFEELFVEGYFFLGLIFSELGWGYRIWVENYFFSYFFWLFGVLLVFGVIFG